MAAFGLLGSIAFALVHVVLGLAFLIAAFLLCFLPVASITVRKVALTSLGIGLSLAASSVVVADTTAGTVLRFVGIVLVLFTAVIGRQHESPAPGPYLPALLAIPLQVFITVATLPHGLNQELAIYTLGNVLLVGLLIGIRALGRCIVAASAFVVLTASLAGSLLLGILLPAIAVEGGRLRGVFENANTLGFVAFVGISMALYVKASPATRILLLISGPLCLIWTGSRASALAAAIAVVGWFISKRSIVGAFLAALLALLGDQLLTTLNSRSDQIAVLLRSNNSRAGSVETALWDWQSSPVVGVGLGKESGIIASSFLRALAQGGVIGVAAISLLVLVFVVLALRANRYVAWFTVAAVVHSFFEGWLLSPLAPLLILFVIAWWIMLTTENSRVAGHLRAERTTRKLIT